MKLFILLALTVSTAKAASLSFGETPDDNPERIYNGQDAKPGEAPYIVSLKVNGDHWCGGSIIHPNWVLTAAHCIYHMDNVDVVAGLHARNNENGTQIRRVKNSNIITHKKYDKRPGPYDIGLIFIAEAFKLNTKSLAPVSKVSLPSGKYPETGRGKVFGWGLDNTLAKPNVLQTLAVNIIDYEECKTISSDLILLDPFIVCTYTPGSYDRICSSDSGGPLVRYTESGVELVGIVSGGPKCPNAEYPNIYVKVSSFKKWIKAEMKNFTQD